MDRELNNTGWYPLRGSYEEAVLTWHEQIDQSFRRRDLEAQRTGTDIRPRYAAGPKVTGVVAD